MKIAQIIDNRLHWLTPYKSWQEVPPFAPDIVLVEAPPEAQEGWSFDANTGEFSPPEDLAEDLADYTPSDTPSDTTYIVKKAADANEEGDLAEDKATERVSARRRTRVRKKVDSSEESDLATGKTTDDDDRG